MRDRQRRRRLAGAADGEVAEANDKHAGAMPLRMHAKRRYRAIDLTKWGKQSSGAGLPPEGRRSHQSMIPKSGYRFSEKIMPI
jgi:hypothetical protein